MFLPYSKALLRTEADAGVDMAMVKSKLMWIVTSNVKTRPFKHYRFS